MKAPKRKEDKKHQILSPVYFESLRHKMNVKL